ncbi:MAG TPA: class I SAM-dependent methyltransferase [Actinomycetota bacterium]|nr:class I SAM-dependent methyltransferase [Actinomycetota bacterium]
MSAGFDEEYFRTLYGEVPRQTRFDRARDDLIVRMVEAHGAREGALLDIGCGYGYLLARFRRRYELFGIDVSVHAARQAAVRLPGVRVVQADVQRPLPFRRRFEVVLAINIVEHLPDPAAGARTIRDALGPGGLCVVHLPTINNAVSRAIYRLAYAADPTHIYRPSGEEVRALFEDAGFEVVGESYAPHTPWLLPGLRWHPAYLAAFRTA